MPNVTLIHLSYSDAKSLASYAMQYMATNDFASLRSEYFGTASTAWPVWIYNQITHESGSNFTLICEPGSGVCGPTTLARTTYSDTVSTNPDGSQTLSNYKAKTEFVLFPFMSARRQALTSKFADCARRTTTWATSTLPALAMMLRWGTSSSTIWLLHSAGQRLVSPTLCLSRSVRA